MAAKQVILNKVLLPPILGPVSKIIFLSPSNVMSFPTVCNPYISKQTCFIFFNSNLISFCYFANDNFGLHMLILYEKLTVDKEHNTSSSLMMFIKLSQICEFYLNYPKTKITNFAISNFSFSKASSNSDTKFLISFV